MKRIYKNICLGLGVLTIISPISTSALTKDETVYSTLSNSGKTKKIFVSEHLINDEKKDTLQDLTNLTNIDNVNGNETFTVDGNNIYWKALGKDIYYQGETNNELPIATNVSYKLNGKVVKPKDIKNKKGHVTITIKYTNKLASNVKGTTLYTPFVVATEMTLSEKTNSNISVTNGKVISNGTNNIIAAISSPGLYESLNVAALKDMDSVVIEYDTTSFEKSDIYSVSTSKVLEDNDFEKLNDVNGIFKEVQELQNASNTIANGSVSLNNGINDLSVGINKLNEGSGALYNGAKEIKNAVDNSITSVKNDNSNALTNEQLEAIKTQTKNSSVLSSAQLDTISNQAIQETENKINNNITLLENNGINDNLINICEANPINNNYQAICSNNLSNILKYKALKDPTTVEILKETAKESAIATASNVAATTAYETAGTVAFNVANNVKTATGNKTVSSLETLSKSLESLTVGLNALKLGTESAKNGVNKIADGSNTLSNGISEFNVKGIKKISNFSNNVLQPKFNNIIELKKLSDNYNTFTMTDSNVTSNTKFITIIK